VQLTVGKATSQPGPEVLVVEHLTCVDPAGRHLLDNVTFSVHAGEIVGIAGVQGNGQAELVEVLTGLRRQTGGRITLDGEDISPKTPRQRHAIGVAHIPEDRQKMGLVGSFSVTENLALTDYYHPPFSSAVSIDWKYCASHAEELVDHFDIRTPGTNVAVGTLSGGNQQKVIAARELSRTLSLVIASQPTRGVDVGSIEYIHRRIVEQRDNGVAVLVVSTELDEVMALADRVIVMFDGKIVADRPRSAFDNTTVGLFMAGAGHEPAT
jgi:simple sugar transport system ATP-binding protein